VPIGEAVPTGAPAVPAATAVVEPARTAWSAAAPLVAGLVALALLGVLAWPLEVLLHAAATIAGTP